MASPYFAKAEDGTQVWKVLSSIHSKQFWIVEKGRSYSLGFRRVANKQVLTVTEQACYVMSLKSSELYGSFRAT
jgi:hypothetical protein